MNGTIAHLDSISGGLISALKAGTATVTARINGYDANCTITITKSVLQVNLQNQKLYNDFAESFRSWNTSASLSYNQSPTGQKTRKYSLLSTGIAGTAWCGYAGNENPLGFAFDIGNSITFNTIPVESPLLKFHYKPTDYGNTDGKQDFSRSRTKVIFGVGTNKVNGSDGSNYTTFDLNSYNIRQDEGAVDEKDIIIANSRANEIGNILVFGMNFGRVGIRGSYCEAELTDFVLYCDQYPDGIPLQFI